MMRPADTMLLYCENVPIKKGCLIKLLRQVVDNVANDSTYFFMAAAAPQQP